MKITSVSGLRKNYRSVIKWIEDGEQVIITRHGKNIAILTPPESPRHKRTSSATRPARRA